MVFLSSSVSEENAPFALMPKYKTANKVFDSNDAINISKTTVHNMQNIELINVNSAIYFPAVAHESADAVVHDIFEQLDDTSCLELDEDNKMRPNLKRKCGLDVESADRLGPREMLGKRIIAEEGKFKMINPKGVNNPMIDVSIMNLSTVEGTYQLDLIITQEKVGDTYINGKKLLCTAVYSIKKCRGKM